MEYNTLSRKRKEEIWRLKEEEKKEELSQFKNGLDDLYFDLYSDDYGGFYNYFMDLLEKKFYCVERDSQSYNDFVSFVDNYSSHKEEFKEAEIERYLDYKSSDEEEEDEAEYEFLNKKIERF